MKGLHNYSLWNINISRGNYFIQCSFFIVHNIYIRKNKLKTWPQFPETIGFHNDCFETLILNVISSMWYWQLSAMRSGRIWSTTHYLWNLQSWLCIVEPWPWNWWACTMQRYVRSGSTNLFYIITDKVPCAEI